MEVRFTELLGRRFCVSLEHIRNPSANAHDNSDEYRSTNPLRDADAKEHHIDEAGEPNSEGYKAEVTPAARWS